MIFECVASSNNTGRSKLQILKIMLSHDISIQHNGRPSSSCSQYIRMVLAEIPTHLKL